MTDDGRRDSAGEPGSDAVDSVTAWTPNSGLSGDFRLRLGVLLALASLGLALAVAGGALGLDDAFTDPESEAEVIVSEDNITVLTGEREVLTVDSLRDVRTVELSMTDDEFQVETERGSNLTEEQRERAVAIAGNNETIQEELGDLEAHTVTVQAILDSGDLDTQPAEPEDGPSPDVELVTDDIEDKDIDVHLSTEVTDDDSVTIHREVASGSQKVAVTVIDTETGMEQYSLVVDPIDSDRTDQQTETEIEQYSLVINLATERVVEVRNDSNDW